MRNCLNCGRRMRCNRMDRARNYACKDWMKKEQEFRCIDGALIGIIIAQTLWIMILLPT